MLDIKNLKVNLEQKMLSSNQIMIMPHIDADFDAIASCLGVSLIAEKLNKDNHILVGDPIYTLDHGVQKIVEESEKNFSILYFNQYQEMKKDDDLNILCDVNKPRLTYVKEFNKDNLVIIDHHDKDSETFDASLLHIDDTASSASEIVTGLLSAYKIKVSPEVANVLLTGITGFLGAHILDSFMQNEEGNIYCLVRPKAKLSAKERLIFTISHYFGDKYLNEIDKRIFVVE